MAKMRRKLTRNSKGISYLKQRQQARAGTPRPKVAPPSNPPVANSQLALERQRQLNAEVAAGRLTANEANQRLSAYVAGAQLEAQRQPGHRMTVNEYARAWAAWERTVMAAADES